MLTGLTEVPEAALTQLLKSVHRDDVETPLTTLELSRVGLQSYAEPLLGQLRGLDRRAVIAVITSVIAERRKHARLGPPRA